MSDTTVVVTLTVSGAVILAGLALWLKTRPEAVSEADERAPDIPFVVTVSWAVGDSLIVEYPDLLPWEARAVLEEAVEQVRSDERADQGTEEAE